MKRVAKTIVENQVKYGSPPETKRALERLMKAGHSRRAAVDRIVVAVRPEVWRVLQGATMDREKFRLLLEHAK